jgi:hypothetical protein
MTHEEILNSNNKLVFRHLVPVPTKLPDFEHKGLRIWYMLDSFICVSPIRSFNQDCCRFIFPYEVSGNRAYECPFSEVVPLSYRSKRNSDTVLVYGNKNPVPFRKAIAMIYKELNKGIKYYSRVLPTTKISKDYTTNNVLRSAGSLKPAYWYNHTIYVLHVDFRCQKAIYRELISQEHIMKLYKFIEEDKSNIELSELTERQKKNLWFNAFGFSHQDFLDLLENCTKDQ